MLKLVNLEWFLVFYSTIVMVMYVIAQLVYLMPLLLPGSYCVCSYLPLSEFWLNLVSMEFLLIFLLNLYKGLLFKLTIKNIFKISIL